VIAYRATRDLPLALARHVGRPLKAERRERGTRHDSRALTCCEQAVFGSRWFRQHVDVPAPARDHDISRATGYRKVAGITSLVRQQPFAS
jgi:hypothetical protein